MLVPLIRICLVCSLVPGAFPTPAAQTSAVLETEDQVIRHYQDQAQPGLELTLEEEREGEVLRLHLHRHREDGSREALLLPVSLSRLSGEDDGSSTWHGKTLYRGTLTTVEVRLDAGRTQLEWLKPGALKAANATQPVAGNHAIVPSEARLQRAKGAFAKADAQLNAAYQALAGELPSELMERVKFNQRQWLKYRDHVEIDGDNAWLVAPGSTRHVQQQTDRTLARTAWLQALTSAGENQSGDGSGHYSDGIRTLAFVQIMEQQRHPTGLYLYTLSSPDVGWPDKPAMGEGSLSGSCNAKGKGQWGSIDGDYPIFAAGGNGFEPPVELELRASQGILHVNHSGEGNFIGDYARLGDLTPADTPMLHLLRLSPTELFDHTTEGIGADDLEHLAVDGEADLYKIRKITPHYLRVGYTGGSVELRRFPAADGSALIAALTTNGRARTLELWTLKALHTTPAKAELPSMLPRLSWTDFYRRPRADDESLVLDYALNENSKGIIALAVPASLDRPPDHRQIFLWDGYGFINRSLPHEY